jgi:Family of unknown function (DUF6500)
MSPALRQKILATCEAKIDAKGPTLGLSFYAFFANKNDDPRIAVGSSDLVDFHSPT